MAFFKRSARANYDLLSGFAWHVPGVGGMFVMLGWLIAGMILGAIVMGLFMAWGTAAEMDLDKMKAWAMLLVYPLQFVPAMLVAKSKSLRNALFDPGYALDNNYYGQTGGKVMAGLVVLAIISLGFVCDCISLAMPDMPEWLEEALGDAVGGSFILNFICVCIFAPFFEEWLCRGIILRGLLNAKRPDGSRMKPVWAIVISALFFAVIHGNPWQAVPAFLFGCVTGYIYYRTGSLKLTLLAHFTNNFIALVLGNIPQFESAESWADVMPAGLFAGLVLLSAIFLIYFCLKVRREIPPQEPRGSCEETVN